MPIDAGSAQVRKSWPHPRQDIAGAPRKPTTPLPDGQITCVVRIPVQPPREKYSASVFQKYVVSLRIPSLLARGVSRSSRTLGAGCGGRDDVARAGDIAGRV